MASSARAVGESVGPAPVLLDEMNGSQPVLQVVEATAGSQVLRQAIERGQPGGEFAEAEHVTLAIPPGGTAALAYPVPAATVLEEQRLEARVWCSRPGMQLGAVVALPRSIDPTTGQPRTLLLRSGVTASAGVWERLTLEGVPKTLAGHVRVARAKYGPDVEELGAYVTHIAVLVPGGSGPTDVWVDNVALYGPLRPGNSETPIDVTAAWSAGAAGGARAGVRTPRRSPPAAPRIIQWQGEPFELLRSIGFDAVWMGRPPSPTELAEANRLGLWLVCPPPTPEVLATRGVGPELDGVLAWDLGELASPDDLALAEEWSRALERFDRAANRPILLKPVAMTREASRIADVLLVGRATVGSTASWLEQAAWLTQARRSARAGAGLWLAIDTHRSAHAATQLAALRGAPAPSGAASYRHLSQAITAAMGVWPRGFVFLSQSSLAADDVETRMRALALELTNLRLGLIEPWLSRGKAAAPARTSQPDLSAMVLTVERSHLVLPMRWGGDAAAAHSLAEGVQPGARTPRDGDSTTLLLPGVPESCEAYLLSVAGPRQVSTRRVAGGVSVTVEQLPDDGFLLLTEDGYAFAQVERRLRANRAAGGAGAGGTRGARAAAGGGDGRAVVAGAVGAVGGQSDLAAVDSAMTAIHRTLASQDFAAAYARAAASDEVLAGLETRLTAAIWAGNDAGTSPLRGDWSTLADVERVALAANGSTEPPVLLPAGEFEDLTALLESGWRRSERTEDGVEASVRLSTDGAHAGSHCLELEARPTADDGRPLSLAAPPVWVTSPPLVIPAGRLLEISGWVRVTETPLGSADPLVIFDSIGGEESAVRIASAPSWRPFRLVRAGPPGAECRVTIALGGVGRAAVDSVQYRFIPLPAAMVR